MNIEKENTKNTDKKFLLDKEVQTTDKNEVKEKNVLVYVKKSVTVTRVTLKKIKLFVY